MGPLGKIVVVGTGYVGLPAALMWARSGVNVVGVDIDEGVVNALNEGTMLVEESDLEVLLQDPIVRGNLTASVTPTAGDVFVIAVPTPVDALRKVAVLNHVEEALASIAPFLQAGNLVIIESTIPPRTCRDVAKPLIEKLTGLRVPEDVMLAHCPERILPGDIFREIVENERIIGGLDEASTSRAMEAYSLFVTGELHATDDVSAELAKLMENAYRDINVALANEFAAICDNLKADSGRVLSLANRHPRVDILKPGIGVGGHCIPVDPWFLKEVAPYDSRLITTARQINDELPAKAAARIRQAVKNTPSAKVTLLGASYKRNTQDVRESPAMQVAEQMRLEGYNVQHLDPLVAGMGYESLEGVAVDSDLIVVLVAHNEIVMQLEDWNSTGLSPAVLWLDD